MGYDETPVLRALEGTLAAERLAREHREGEAARSVFERMRQQHYEAPTGFLGAAPQRVPTISDAMREGGTAAPAVAAPQVDAAKMEEGRDKAREVGRQIKEALEVKAAPSVETAGLERALGLARQLRHELEGVGRAHASIRYGMRGLAPSSHALHDGPEAH